MNIDSLTNVREQIERQVATLEDQVDDLQSEINPRKRRIEILSCLLTITKGIDEVSNLDPCPRATGCLEKLEAAQAELSELYQALCGVVL